ncbi:F-BAR domain only protein 2 isoform X2 [Daktulosphaira vitifoliae]|nr:F-BAR domain only protein 2 isoform X2 [Daktulosphaira vitifoliae]
MKHGSLASKDFSDFLRERTNIEETCSKLLAKLAKQTSSTTTNSTFTPLWQLLRASIEKLTTLHLQMVHKVCELVKDVTKYTDELHKKHKNVKEEQSGTLEAVQSIQSTTLALQKAKDIYLQKGGELDKLRKDNASVKDIEKAEIKLKKTQDDYKILIDKYGAVKEEFEKKMTSACKLFQEVEESHLKQMKDFLSMYTELIETNHDEIGKVHVEFKKQCLELTVDKLLEQFVLSKYTGLEKPETIEFEDVCLSSSNSACQIPDSFSDSKSIQGTNSPILISNPPNLCTTSISSEKSTKREGNCSLRDRNDAINYQSSRATSLLNIFISNSHGALSKSNRTISLNADHSTYSLPQSSVRGSKWFLRSRRDKRKEKKTKKKKDSNEIIANAKEEKSDEEKEEQDQSKISTPEIDDEGYRIQPSSQWNVDKGSFYSTSDSDEERDKRLHVEIKPLSNGSGPISASVDELRATVENLSLMPLGAHTLRNRRGSANDDGIMKRSKSVSQQLNSVKISNDLIGLNLFQSSASSPNSTQQPYSSLNSPTLSLPNKSISPSNINTPVASKYAADLGDLFFEVGDTQHPTQTKQSPSSTTSVGSISIPRPPSRRENTGPRSQLSPISIGRADSVSSLEFRSSGVVGQSRVPSPLTIGLSDTFPLAIAFHEIIHAYFKGSNESRCQVKMFGDMMVSFPAGIVNVLANNPNPAKLTFRLKNTMRVENLLPNKQLVNIDNTIAINDSIVYEFNMPALTLLLRKQYEKNPVASYFNVDILKYQIKCKNSAATSCPLQLVSFYKCCGTHTDLKIDYKFNSHSMNVPSSLLNVSISTNLNTTIQNMQSKPPAQWQPDTKTAVWKFAELSQHSGNQGSGSLKARFEVDTLCPVSTIITQFNCEGTTLSGVEFELASSGYRVSLIKKRFVAGKYICDSEPDAKSSVLHSNVSSNISSTDC